MLYLWGKWTYIVSVPKNTHIKSDVPNKPLGVPSFGIHVPHKDTKWLRQLAEEAETQDIMFVESVSILIEDNDEGFQSESESENEDDLMSVPSQRFRDPIAQRAENLLLGVKYPGNDSGNNWHHQTTWDDPDWFHVYRIEYVKYYIWDYHHSSCLEGMEVYSSKLKDLDYQVDKASWMHLGNIHLKLVKSWLRQKECKCTDKKPPMERPIEEHLEWWLHEYMEPTMEDMTDLVESWCKEWILCGHLESDHLRTLYASISRPKETTYRTTSKNISAREVLLRSKVREGKVTRSAFAGPKMCLKY